MPSQIVSGPYVKGKCYQFMICEVFKVKRMINTWHLQFSALCRIQSSKLKVGYLMVTLLYKSFKGNGQPNAVNNYLSRTLGG